MSTSRAEFYPSLRRMLELSSESLLTDSAPNAKAHNVGAAILRQGMAITSFARLESYMEDRISEVVLEVASSSVPYQNFPDKLKKFVVIDAMSGLTNRSSFLDKADLLAYLEAGIRQVSSFDGQPRILTGFGFSPKGSNVSKEHVSAALGAFGYHDPWKEMTRVASLIGSARVSISDDYATISKRRNQSAHNSSFNIATQDLISHIKVCILIGIVFDILLTFSAFCFKKSTNMVGFSRFFASGTHRFRFLDTDLAGSVAERVSAGTRVIRHYASESEGRRGVAERRERLPTIIRDAQLVPVELV